MPLLTIKGVAANPKEPSKKVTFDIKIEASFGLRDYPFDVISDVYQAIESKLEKDGLKLVVIDKRFTP